MANEGQEQGRKLDLPSSIQILFVCSGNTCRSPMAEGVCKSILCEKLECNPDELPEIGVVVVSAGTSAETGEPASTESILAMQKRDIDISTHQSQVLTVDLVQKSNFIFAMGGKHLRKIIELCPEAEGKCSLLSADSEIEDPYEMGQERYEVCADQILEAVRRRVEEILGAIME